MAGVNFYLFFFIYPLILLYRRENIQIKIIKARFLRKLNKIYRYRDNYEDAESNQTIKSGEDTASTTIGINPCQTPQISEHCP